MEKEIKEGGAKLTSIKKSKIIEKNVAKKDAVKIYKTITLWVSMILAILLLIEQLVIIETSGGPSALLQLSNLSSSIAFYLFYGLLIYSIVMLIYIFAKKRNDVYLFSILIPVFFVLSVLAEIVVSSLGPYGANMPPQGWGYFLLMTIMFLYTLYNKWKNNLMQEKLSY